MKGACIYCGCTESRACRYEPSDVERRAIKYLVALDGKIACYWLSTDPPVCSAPSCRRQHATATSATINHVIGGLE